jgi:lipopolysaccharide/colanic/teichoic acid biosynthesis glycosyltransferase
MRFARSWLLLFDALAVVAAFFLSFAVRIPFRFLDRALPEFVDLLLPLLVLRLALFALFGLYRPIWAKGAGREFVSVLASVTVGSVLATLAFVWITLNERIVMFPRSVLVFEWALTLALVAGTRYSLRILDVRDLEPHPTENVWASLEVGMRDIWRLPKSRKAWVAREAANVIDVLPVAAFPAMVSRRSTGMAAKRALDVVVASAALVVASPLLLFIVLLVWIESGRPIMYRSQRLGKCGRVFTMLKFRTMVQDAEAQLAKVMHLNVADGMVKIPNDPRVTTVGRWLRRTSLDEIPNLWNVLRGEMSLVGPRPHEPQDISLSEPVHRLRLLMPPGITGLWQVTARDHPSLAVRVYYDLAYVYRWTLWLDVKILLRTVGVVFQGGGGSVDVQHEEPPRIGGARAEAGADRSGRRDGTA